MRKNRIRVLLNYARTTRQKEWFSGRELFEMQKEAVIHFNKEARAEEITNEILASHGWTREQWNKVLLQSGSFYFIPTPETEEINKKIRSRLQGKLYRECWQLNYFYGCLFEATKTGAIQRRKENGRWMYS